MSGVLAAITPGKITGVVVGGGEWSVAEQLALVEAVQQ